MTDNFYRCTDPDLNMPSLCRNKPDRPTWVRYINDSPVKASPNYPADRVWDYAKGTMVDTPRREI